MARQKIIRALISLFIFCAVVFFLISCGPKVRVAVSQLDTPGHHTFTGLKLLDQEKYADAKREFEMKWRHSLMPNIQRLIPVWP